MRPTVPALLRPLCTAASLTLAAALAPAALSAQQTQLDLHGDIAVGTTTHLHSWGGGAAVPVTIGQSSSPVQLSVSPGIDYTKQEHGGPSQTSVGADVNVQPGGGKTVTPYVGASASANWSGGAAKQWEGARAGYETLAGAQVKLTSKASAKVEERFGYVTGQEHTLSTHAGVLLSF